MAELEVLDRDHVMRILWSLIFCEQNQQVQAAYALAYCRIREMPFHNEKTLKEMLK